MYIREKLYFVPHMGGNSGSACVKSEQFDFGSFSVSQIFWALFLL